MIKKSFRTISGREVILDTSVESCCKFKAKSGQIFLDPGGQKIEIVGVGPVNDSFFEGKTIWAKDATEGGEAVFYIEPQSGFLPFPLPGEGYFPIGE